MAKKSGEDITPNFNIESTSDMGAGDPTLLQDLVAPETSTSEPGDIEKIVKEVKTPETIEKKEVKAGDEIINKEEDDLNGEELITNFLSRDPEDEEDEAANAAAAAKKPKPGEEIIKKVIEGDDEGDDITKKVINKDGDQAGTQFGALTQDLLKLGVFSTPEGAEEPEINTPQEFLERFNTEKKRTANDMLENFIGQFGEDYQNAFEAIYVKGVNPKEYFGAYNQVVSLAELDMTEEDNQAKVMRQALTKQGFDAEDIDTEIERIKNYGDLESVAGKHHKALVKLEAQGLREKEQQAEVTLQQKNAVRSQYIENVQGVLQEKIKAKEFDGIPINGRIANELQDFLLVDKYKTASGETLTDFDKTILELKRPENHAMKVKVALLLKTLEKDPTLSTIQRKAISKESDVLFKEVARHGKKGKTKTSPTEQQGANRWFL